MCRAEDFEMRDSGDSVLYEQNAEGGEGEFESIVQKSRDGLPSAFI
jgi:hypothetical protein